MREKIKENQGEIEIDLHRLFIAYLKKWWLILVCAIIGAAAAFFFTFCFITPLYRSSVSIYVNNQQSGTVLDYSSTSNIQASRSLVDTYINILNSNTVKSKIIEKAGLSCSLDEFSEMISSKQVESTELFTVSISHPDPEMAAHIANTVAVVAPIEIENFVDGSSTKIIDYATVAQHPYTPSYPINIVIGAFWGIFIVLVYLTITCLLDVRIKEESDLTALFDIPVLAQIPVINSRHRNAYESKGGSHN